MIDRLSPYRMNEGSIGLILTGYGVFGKRQGKGTAEEGLFRANLS